MNMRISTSRGLLHTSQQKSENDEFKGEVTLDFALIAFFAKLRGRFQKPNDAMKSNEASWEANSRARTSVAAGGGKEIEGPKWPNSF
jgi:hypothetical protein